MYGRRTNYLFQGSPVHGFIHGTQTRAMRQLEVLDENTILNTPTEDLVAGALSACAVDFPTLREGEIWQEDNEVLSPDHAPWNPFSHVRAAHARRRPVRPDRCAATRKYNAFGVDLPRSAAHRGTMPRRSSAGWREAKRDGAE